MGDLIENGILLRDRHFLLCVSQCCAFCPFKRQETSIIVKPTMDHLRNGHLRQSLSNELNRFALQSHICCPNLHFAECTISDGLDCRHCSSFMHQEEFVWLRGKSIFGLLRCCETQNKPWISVSPRRNTWVSRLGIGEPIAFDRGTKEPKRRGGLDNRIFDGHLET